MKKWVLVEMKNGDEYETILKAATRYKALTEARKAWERLSDYDKKNRDDFFVVFVELNEDGSIDFDSETDYISKEEVQLYE